MEVPLYFYLLICWVPGLVDRAFAFYAGVVGPCHGWHIFDGFL